MVIVKERNLLIYHLGDLNQVLEMLHDIEALSYRHDPELIQFPLDHFPIKQALAHAIDPHEQILIVIDVKPPAVIVL